MPQKLPSKTDALGIKKIQGMLPHRYPFLFVDRVLELKKGESIVALKNVTCNEPFFLGHFPHHKIMPGVLIVEALAQAGGILLYNSIADPERKFVFLSKIDGAKFRRPVVPGDQLELRVKILKLRSRFCHVQGTAFVDGKVVVECDIIASAMDLEDLNGQG